MEEGWAHRPSQHPQHGRACQPQGADETPRQLTRAGVAGLVVQLHDAAPHHWPHSGRGPVPLVLLALTVRDLMRQGCAMRWIGARRSRDAGSCTTVRLRASCVGPVLGGSW